MVQTLMTQEISGFQVQNWAPTILYRRFYNVIRLPMNYPRLPSINFLVPKLFRKEIFRTSSHLDLHNLLQPCIDVFMMSIDSLYVALDSSGGIFKCPPFCPSIGTTQTSIQDNCGLSWYWTGKFLFR